MRKKIKAVAPYVHPEFLNFKTAAYEAWVKMGGDVANAHYPWRPFHGPVFRHELPTIREDQHEARLRFVEPISIYFDTFPDYTQHEIIPMIWDCWPCYFDKMEAWLKRHRVRTAIFTSSQEMAEMQRRVPGLNVFFCPEAVDTSLFDGGRPLHERSIDLLEFGRSNEKVLCKGSLPTGINHVCTKQGDVFIYDNERLRQAMGDAKITICLPKTLTHPEIAEGIETLTQRYWEAMLSRMVIVGHAPQELIDLIGYNPVIEIGAHPEKQIQDILSNLGNFQSFVNKNRQTAIEQGDWGTRMKMIQTWLTNLRYGN